MIAAIGRSLARVFERTAPDPLVLAIILSIVTAIAALILGDFGDLSLLERTVRLLGNWSSGAALGDGFAGSGLWAFLAFGMQMCLVLVTGHALAAAPPVAKALRAASDVPKSPAAAALMVALVASLTGLLNWGLGLIVGATLARETAASCARRNIPVAPALLAAAGYSAMLVWHGGLSGSAPLTVTTEAGAAAVLGPDQLQALGGSIPLTATLFSLRNAIVTAGLVIIAAALFALMARGGVCAHMPPPSLAPVASDLTPQPASIPDHLARSRALAWLLAAALFAAFALYLARQGIARLDLNAINLAMLAAGIALHASPASYARAVEDGARGSAGIILQFPLYAGILAMLQTSGLAAGFATALADLAPPWALPAVMFVAAAVINFFVPSGGGQWGIQGPIALDAATSAGLDPGEMVMAVAYGDQLTNMLQPFWALPLLAITGCRAREIIGPTAVVMLAAAAWTLLWLLVL